MTAQNGTLYSDSFCTMALTSGTVTLPAGASSIGFGFVPLAAGQSGFQGMGPGSSPIGESFLAQ